jgi:tRNA(Ile)-lysidine synthase
VAKTLPFETSLAEASAALLPRDQAYLIGVSGGRDSMALLHGLVALGYGKSAPLIVVHVNHGLRAAESDGDEIFVRTAAEELGLTCESSRSDVRQRAVTQSISLETAAREARYEAFAEWARQHACPRVVLAHHADDQVETVLMNLFRGAGWRGLGGMIPSNTRDIGGTKLNLLRPLLGIFRESIDDYVRRRLIAFREDASNAILDALRNRVRHQLMPILTDVFQRDVRDAVLHNAEIAQKTEAWIADHSGDLPRLGSGLAVAPLRLLPTARREHLLLEWLRESAVPDCGRREVAGLDAVVCSQARPATFNLPGGFRARRRAGQLWLEGPIRPDSP